ncbi:MAG: glycosyltransferase [Planctomycetota bacterium]
MRIVHLIPSLDPQQGGPPRVAAALAAATATLGHEVSLIAYTPHDRLDATRLAYQDTPGLDDVVQLTPEPLRRSAALPLAKPHRLYDGVLLTWLNAADIVHLHGLWEHHVFHASKAARQTRTPYIITPHGMLDPWSLQQKRLKKKLALALGYRRMLNHAAGLHLLNDDEQRLIEPLKLRTPTFILPNGIFLDEIDSPPPEDATPENLTPDDTSEAVPTLPPGTPYILFLSRLHFKKGLDILAEAFVRVAEARPEIHLVVAGPDGGAQAGLEQAIADAGLSDRVHLPGLVVGRDKINLIRGARLFCLPSRQEGFSMAITEALACATPVVITDACHFPEVAEHDAGRVTSVEPEPIAQAILETLASPEAAVQQGQRGRALVEARYTWPQIAQRLVEQYRSLGR